MLTFFYWLTLVLFILVCFLLIALVLIQKGKGGGLAGAFGGGGGGHTPFGTKTGDILTWATSILFGIFILLAIGLNLIINYRTKTNAPVLPKIEHSFVIPDKIC
jgi:preprotein translocase subunit SecG